ncbi:MAG: aroQ [Clostridia bacterium]|jgi:3-dehydroquinate dehydratase-2|nr:aroQ [Clostridia bacterium]
MSKILVINGPNMNMLGVRDTSVYGIKTLKEINALILEEALHEKVYVDFFQSNSEGELIDAIHETHGKCDGIIINAGAYSHYSYAIRDAIESVGLPTIEVHMSNIYKRDEFRRHSVISEVCIGQISGLGYRGYVHALRALSEYLKGV